MGERGREGKGGGRELVGWLGEKGGKEEGIGRE